MSNQFSSVAQSCPTLWDPKNCSTPGLPVHHQLPESTQTHVRWVGDAIQPSPPLSSPSPPALNLSQHQGFFQWVSSLHQVAKGLEFQLQYCTRVGNKQILSLFFHLRIYLFSIYSWRVVWPDIEFVLHYLERSCPHSFRWEIHCLLNWSSSIGLRYFSLAAFKAFFLVRILITMCPNGCLWVCHIWGLPASWFFRFTLFTKLKSFLWKLLFLWILFYSHHSLFSLPRKPVICMLTLCFCSTCSWESVYLFFPVYFLSMVQIE